MPRLAYRTRRQANASNADSNDDFWYAGGSYTPGAGYNVYGLRVTPAVDGIDAADGGGNNYFLNARDASGEAHEVWKLDFEASFPVLGSGNVTFTAYDPNCLQIMNNAETARPASASMRRLVAWRGAFSENTKPSGVSLRHFA